MRFKDSHVSDQDLILAADGELSRRQLSAIQTHLEGCWVCRGRMKDLEDTIAEFIRTYRETLDAQLPPGRASRAELKARISELAAQRPQVRWYRRTLIRPTRNRVLYVAATFALVIIAVLLWPPPPASLAISPNPRLTPGAVLPVTAADICRIAPRVKPRDVVASVGNTVFSKYGIHNPQPRYFEMDYLIDPDLGGSDDPSNLWPQPYSAEWSAHVKDALEDHLRELVCSQQITLAEAQRDIAADWIAAYRKYFHTNHPLPDHIAFQKDEPWE